MEENNNTQSITPEVPLTAQVENAEAKNTNEQNTETKGPMYANLFWRLAALFTDIWFYFLLLIILATIPIRILSIQTYDTFSKILDYKIFSIPLIVILLVASKIFVFDSYLKGKTPGRLLYGLRVTDIEGKPLVFWKSIMRSSISLILLVCAVYGINEFGFTPAWRRNDILVFLSISLVLGFDIFIFFTPLKQTLYDKLLGSVVVKKKGITDKLGCFIYVWAVATIVIPCLAMLIMGMLQGLKH